MSKELSTFENVNVPDIRLDISQELRYHDNSVNFCCFISRGFFVDKVQRAATVSHDKKIVIWKIYLLTSLSIQEREIETEAEIYCCRVFRNFLVTSNWCGEVTFRMLPGFELAAVVSVGERFSAINRFYVLDDRHLGTTCGFGKSVGEIALIQVTLNSSSSSSEHQVRETTKHVLLKTRVGKFKDHNHGVFCLSQSLKRKEIIFSCGGGLQGEDARIRCWDWKNRVLVTVFPKKHSARIQRMCLYVDPGNFERLISSSLDRKLIIWNTEGLDLRIIDVPDNIVCFSNMKNEIIFLGAQCGSILFFDIDETKIFDSIDGHENVVYNLEITTPEKKKIIKKKKKNKEERLFGFMNHQQQFLMSSSQDQTAKIFKIVDSRKGRNPSDEELRIEYLYETLYDHYVKDEYVMFSRDSAFVMRISSISKPIMVFKCFMERSEIQEMRIMIDCLKSNVEDLNEVVKLLRLELTQKDEIIEDQKKLIQKLHKSEE